jgi:hypothetical protein
MRSVCGGGGANGPPDGKTKYKIRPQITRNRKRASLHYWKKDNRDERNVPGIGLYVVGGKKKALQTEFRRRPHTWPSCALPTVVCVLLYGYGPARVSVNLASLIQKIFQKSRAPMRGPFGSQMLTDSTNPT